MDTAEKERELRALIRERNLTYLSLGLPDLASEGRERVIESLAEITADIAQLEAELGYRADSCNFTR